MRKPVEIEAKFAFFKWEPDVHEHCKPYEVAPTKPLPEGSLMKSRLANVAFEEVDGIRVTDMRGKESTFSLDEHGFQVIASRNCASYAAWKLGSFETKEEIEMGYLPLVERMVLEHVRDAKQVCAFDWRLRSSASDVLYAHLTDQVEYLPVSAIVHIDQTPEETVKRIIEFYGDDAWSLLQGRVRIVNFWKPLRYCVEDRPLTMCDGQTVHTDDLVKTDIVLGGNRPRETYNVRYNATQKWYYLSEQKPEEAFLIKMFDSDSTVKAKHCPHTSFRLKDAAIDARPRESIEVRCFVFS